LYTGTEKAGCDKCRLLALSKKKRQAKPVIGLILATLFEPRQDFSPLLGILVLGSDAEPQSILHRQILTGLRTYCSKLTIPHYFFFNSRALQIDMVRNVHVLYSTIQGLYLVPTMFGISCFSIKILESLPAEWYKIAAMNLDMDCLVRLRRATRVARIFYQRRPYNTMNCSILLYKPVGNSRIEFKKMISRASTSNQFWRHISRNHSSPLN